jgi:hypothetical protein
MRATERPSAELDLSRNLGLWRVATLMRHQLEPSAVLRQLDAFMLHPLPVLVPFLPWVLQEAYHLLVGVVYTLVWVVMADEGFPVLPSLPPPLAADACHPPLDSAAWFVAAWRTALAKISRLCLPWM